MFKFLFVLALGGVYFLLTPQIGWLAVTFCLIILVLIGALLSIIFSLVRLNTSLILVHEGGGSIFEPKADSGPVVQESTLIEAPVDPTHPGLQDLEDHRQAEKKEGRS